MTRETPLTTENYQYRLDEQRRQKIQAQFAQDRLAATLPHRTHYNGIVLAVRIIAHVFAVVLGFLFGALRETTHTLGHFLVWLGHHLEGGHTPRGHLS